METRPVIDFIDNILFLLIHQSCVLVEVEEVIIYRQADFFRPYITYLQHQRGKSTSKLLSKQIKALGKYIKTSQWIRQTSYIYIYIFLPPTGNCLVGKLHQKLESYCHATICTSIKEFDKAINDVSFMDFHVLSPTTTIIIKDGVIIKSHSNIPSISAR